MGTPCGLLKAQFRDNWQNVKSVGQIKNVW
jgi:hypothetical protein